MKAVHDWSMKHASAVLHGISVVLFLIGTGQAVLAMKTTVGNTLVGGAPVGAGFASFLVFLSGTFSALSSAAIPFIGAAFLHRWDAKNGS